MNTILSKEHLCIADFQRLLGPKNVLINNLERYQESSLGQNTKVTASLIIEHQAQIADCLEIATHHRTPLYPISTGNNWGYGGATPVHEHGVILDLSNLTKIIDFNAELGLVTLEPGVTQGQLRAFLDEKEANLMVPTTGAGPNCSLVGNALERGFGPAACHDHFLGITHFKAVLADGSIYQSALTECGAPLSDKAYKWGIGPYLDGLFTQSNFAIITEATIALAPQPERFTVFQAGSNDPEAIRELAGKVRELLFTHGSNIGFINLMNQQRVLSMLTSEPADPEQMAEQAKNYNISEWNLIGVIHGSSAMVKACSKDIKALLKPDMSYLSFVSDKQVSIINKLSPLFPDKYQKMIKSLTQFSELARGIPNELALPLAYWKNPNKSNNRKNLNPDRDHCGLIWYAPVIPLLEDKIADYVNMVYELCEQYNFHPLLTLTAISPRYVESTFPILFDKMEAGASEKAEEFFQKLVARGKKIGVFPYRLPSTQMHLLNQENTTQAVLIKKIKQAIDPLHIIAPGRYGF